MTFILFETFVGDETAPGNDGLWSMDCSAVLRVKTIHISSPILAAKSPFFYKVMVLLCCMLFLVLGYLYSLICSMPPAVVFKRNERVRAATSNSKDPCIW